MSGSTKKPEIIVFAGPNGSGKSTFTEVLRPNGIFYINADDIQRALGCENNVARVSGRVSAGGHDVPVDKIISRYHKALALVPQLVPVCDVCHIYDNSDTVYRIFKKRKEQCWYSPLEGCWLKKDIIALTGVKIARRAALNQ